MEYSQLSGSAGRFDIASKRRKLSHETGASATLESGQKSSVVPSSGSYSFSTRSGQSAGLMSQKQHSLALGTRLGAVRRRVGRRKGYLATAAWLPGMPSIPIGQGQCAISLP